VPGLGRLVRVLNARAVTIYLWHNIAVDLCFPITNWLRWSGLPAQLVVTAALVTVAVLAFGWVEDLAARRPMRLIPGRRARAAVVAPAQPEPVPSGG
jgi:peptidoglycan/LPS O-acetylase OafA/YrhL